MKCAFNIASLTIFGAVLVIAFFSPSCIREHKKSEQDSDTLSMDTLVQKPISPLEKKLDSIGLVDIRKIDTSILVDMKYSTTDNFMEMDMYGDFDKAYFQKEVAEKLVLAQQKLTEQKPGFYLIIYDAARPRSIQQLMWDSLKMPLSEKYKYLADPKVGSLHNYGCAVDLSITSADGKALDMGTPFDYSGQEAWPSMEEAMIRNKKLTRQQVENRKLLRTIMYAAGFTGIKTEWWHFDACNIIAAKSRYKIIE